jgi:hypothetical protein
MIMSFIFFDILWVKNIANYPIWIRLEMVFWFAISVIISALIKIRKDYE